MSIWRNFLTAILPAPPEPEKKPRRRSFKSAKVDRLNFGMPTVPQPIDYDLQTQLYALTARARSLAQNDDYVRRYLRVAKNNIAGPRGIELRANYMAPGGTPNKMLSDAVEAAWRDWSRKGMCEVSGRFSWVDAQHLVIEHLARDGEALIVMQPKGRYGFQLQFLDPMVLGVRYNQVLNSQREVVMGVEIDRQTRRPLAYYIHVNETNQPDTVFFEGKNYRRIRAEFVLHLYRQEQIFQTRGFSPLASAIMRLNMLNGYEDAALTAARAGAARMGFYEQTGDVPFEGDDEDSAEGLLEDFEAGTMTMLPRGYKVHAFETGWPNVDHADYVKAVLRGVASGIGVSYNTLANDLEGVNFSSMRAGVLEDREEWKNAQRWLADNFCQPVFEVWLDRALTLGLIRNKGQALTEARYDTLRDVTWQGRRWDWVDPQKDIQANTTAIDYRIRSISDVIREQGRDPDEVFAEIKRDEERLAEMGIEVIRNGNHLSDTGAADEGSGRGNEDRSRGSVD